MRGRATVIAFHGSMSVRTSVFAGLLVFGLCLGSPSSLAGGEERVSLDLKRAPLREALETLAQRTGLHLVYANRLLEGVTVAGRVSGTPAEAVAQLLRGACLGARWSDARRVTLYPLPNAAPVELRGHVTGLNGPLPGAVVRLVGANRIAVADEGGYFELPRLPSQGATLRVHADGHVPALVSWRPERDGLELTLLLSARPFVTERLTVTAPLSRSAAQAMTEGGVTVAPDELYQRGSATRDLFQGLRALPGVDAGFADAGVSVHGARPSENLVLLDQIKLYQLDHAMGYFSALNPDAIQDIAVFKGGAPAQYGDRIAGVLDMRVKGDVLGRRELRAGFDRDLAHATALQPLGSRATVLVSARQSISEATARSVSDRIFASAFNEAPPASQGAELDFLDVARDFHFEDQLLRFTWRPNDRDTWRATGFRGEDSALERLSIVDPEDPDFEPLLGYQRDSQWGNDGASLRWSRKWAGGQTRLAATWSRFASDFEFFELADAGDFGLEEDAPIERTFDSRIEESGFELAHLFEWDGRHALELGLFGSRINVDFREAIQAVQLEETERDETEQRGLFLQHEWHGAPGFHSLVGVRIGHNESSDTDYVDPRFSVQMDIGPHSSLYASWGEFRQFALRSADTANYFAGIPTWFLAGEDGPLPGVSRNAQMGFRYDRAGFRFETEVYLKSQEGSLSKLFDPLQPEFEVFQWVESHRGVDLLAEKRVGGWVGRVSYSFRRSRVIREALRDEALDYPADRDRPHSLHLAVSRQTRRWDFLASWRYVSGAPYGEPTPFLRDFDGDDVFWELGAPANPNALRLPAAQTVDARLGYRFALGRGEAQLGVSVANLFDRRNILSRLFAIEDEDFEDPLVFPIDVEGFGRRISLEGQIRF